MKIRLAAPLTVDSIVDGPGLRTVIWTQGCIHACSNCHNPDTHDLLGGYEVDTEDIIRQIRNVKLQQGITLSGGEPFLQARALVPVAKEAKMLGLSVWAYTGFLWEQLNNKRHVQHNDFQQLLRHTDVLVDGKFVDKLRSVDLLYRGSVNQRIIDVQSSLGKERPILLEQYMKT